MEWLVLLEAERGGAADAVDGTAITRLVDRLGEPAPGALHSDDRYALQLAVDAVGPADAVALAVHRWEAALDELDLPHWQVVRVEALTHEELQHEFLLYEGTAPGERPQPSPSPEESQARDVEDRLLRHAFHDPLTNLASQTLFRTYLEHSIGGAHPALERCALLLVDVDRFAHLNERLGWQRADSVLVAVAQRLDCAAGSASRVARLGGDQFAALLPVGTADEAQDAAAGIIAAMAMPVLVDGTKVEVTVSVGIALAERGTTGDELLHRATLAVRSAQDRGGHRYELFAHDMTDVDVSRLRSERDAMVTQDTDSSLALLERVSLSIEECRSLEDAGLVVLRHLCEDAGFPVGRLYVTGDEDGADPLPAGVWIVGAPTRFATFRTLAEREPLRLGEGVAGRALAARALVCVRDIRFEPGLAIPHEAVVAGLRGALALPVLLEGDVVAVLELFAEQALECSDLLIELLTTVRAHLAVVARGARSERARSQAEARLNLFLSTAGASVKVLGSDGRLREQYPDTWPAETAYPMSAVDFLHPNDLPVAVRGWAEALASHGRHPPFECRVRMEDGTWRWMEITATNLLDDPAVGGIVTAARCIDDRKRADDARRQAESHLRETQALGRIGTWHADLLNHVVEWSEELYRVLGVAPCAVDPGFASLLELAHPDDRPRLAEQQWLLENGAGQVLLFRVGRPGGPVRWISGTASAVRDEAGRVVALHGSAQDVTDRWKLERALEATSDRLRAVESLAGVGSWYTDAATGVTSWSTSLYDMLGLDPGQVRAGSDLLLAAVHPDDRTAVALQMLGAPGAARPVDFDCRIVRPGADECWVRVRSSVTRDRTGAITAYHGVVHEIDARTMAQGRVPF